MASGVKNNSRMVEETGVTVTNQQGSDRHISIYEEDMSFSVYNLLPSNSTFLRDKMKDVPDNYRNMDHYELRKELKPSPTLNQLRINFWSEYDRCADIGGPKRKIQIINVIAGVCSLRVFKEHMKDTEKLAWLMTPVQSYQMGVQDILETCLYKMRISIDKLDMGDVKDLNTVMKIYETFDKRVHGDYEQKITKSVEYKGTGGILDAQSIEKKMKELGINNNTVVVYDGDGDRNEK